jgi:hypothetical protein
MAAVCPMCHCPNRDTAKECCECGYEFGQSLETLRGLLGSQLRNARAMFWVLAIADACIIASLFWAAKQGLILIPMLPIAFLTWQAVRAAHTIRITKHSLRLVAKQDQQVPKATVVSR